MRQARGPAVTNWIARHLMSEDRLPNGGVYFASKTNTQMLSGIGLRRLFYKGFEEAKLTCPDLSWTKAYEFGFCRIHCY
jgi:hypothetical protein